ncbi:hypothetical protein POM88_050369 [Heracleum sosnowskyi]|uniref:Transcription repressor n=1 Tax=Heracleum sosnowskyi TaxID=360622 RepID=A0AAD8GYN0_9APIA|nr:hypothetical protein POM88_050369 [Heracleum sosnowskyi]
MESSTSINNHHHQKVEKCSMLDLVSQLELKPIITKLINKGDSGTEPAIKFQGSSKKFEKLSEESIDPDRDFKESMMEMFMEHNMSTKEEFEQLLACYLSLNPVGCGTIQNTGGGIVEDPECKGVRSNNTTNSQI